MPKTKRNLMLNPDVLDAMQRVVTGPWSEADDGPLSEIAEQAFIRVEGFWLLPAGTRLAAGNYTVKDHVFEQLTSPHEAARPIFRLNL